MSGAGRDARDAGVHGDRPHAEAKGSAMGRILMVDIDGTVAGCREGIEAICTLRITLEDLENALPNL